MANDAPTPTMNPGGTPISTVEATNARMLNETLGKLIEASGGSAADLVTALNSIASAITASIIGGTTGATANRVLVSKGTAGRALQPTLVTLDPAAAGFAASAITFAATQRVLGRNTSGAGTGEEVTLTQLLDWISASVARGDLLRRGASAWERVALGANGTVLTSNGTDPAWSAAQRSEFLIASGALSSVSSLDVALDGQTWDEVELRLIAIQPATDNVEPWLRFSQDGGSTFLSGASDYAWAIQTNGTGGSSAADSEITLSGQSSSNVAGELGVYTVKIFRPGASSFQKDVVWYGGQVSQAASAHVADQGWGKLAANTNAITDVRFVYSSGNISTGFYYAIGKAYSA